MRFTARRSVCVTGVLIVAGLLPLTGVAAEELNGGAMPTDGEEPVTGGARDNGPNDNMTAENGNATADTPWALPTLNASALNLTIAARNALHIEDLTIDTNITLSRLILETFRCAEPACKTGVEPLAQVGHPLDAGDPFPVEIRVGANAFARGETYAFRLYALADDGQVYLLVDSAQEQWFATVRYDAAFYEPILAWLADLPTLAIVIALVVLCILVLGLVLLRWIARAPRPQKNRQADGRPPDGARYGPAPEPAFFPSAPGMTYPQPAGATVSSPPPPQHRDPRPPAPASGAWTGAARADVVVPPAARMVEVNVVGRRSRRALPGVPVHVLSGATTLTTAETGDGGRARLLVPVEGVEALEFVTALPAESGYANGKFTLANAHHLPARIELEVGYERRLTPAEESRLEAAFAKGREALDPLGDYAPAVTSVLAAIFDARAMMREPTRWGLVIPGGPAAVAEAIEAFARATETAAARLGQVLSNKALVNTLVRVDLTEATPRSLAPWTPEVLAKQAQQAGAGVDAAGTRGRELQEMLAKVSRGMDTRLFDSLHRVSSELVEAARTGDGVLDKLFLAMYAQRVTEALRTLLQFERLRDELRRIGPL